MFGRFKPLFATLISVSLISCASTKPSTSNSALVNQLSEQEVADGWISMFDGKTTDGWRGYRKQHFPSAWTIDGDTLHFLGGKNLSASQKEDRGDIIFDRPFENFSFSLEWKISKAGNSGIFYLGQESESFDFIWQTAPEMQVLDNQDHPDANKGKNGNRQAGSLYDLIPANPQNAVTVGDWNKIVITVKDRHVTHTQNGVVVVEYDLDTAQWQAMVANSKFPGLNENWVNVAKSGYIGLQDHDDPVWYRNIKIKPL